MSGVIVYHGGTEIVEKPICDYGRPNLDFGKGFYVTDIRQQAIDWAVQVARRKNMQPIISRYRLERQPIIETCRSKVFEAYDKDWLEFIVASRRGLKISDYYDYIEGGIANDRVVDTVNLYMTGLMELTTALKRLSQHQPNNQICLLNQEITDKYLIFDGAEAI